jgi:inosine/xanthosine triphosphatase
MMIVVASKNEVKIEAAKRGFARMFPEDRFEIVGISVPSGVSDQPMGDEETRRGAKNRLEAVKQAEPEADMWIAIEGGCADTNRGMETFAWIAGESKEGIRGESRTAMFSLPPAVAALVRTGMELGHADDQIFGRENSKERNGSVGLLTDNVIDRTEYYAHAVALALIPFKQKDLYLP